MRTSSLPTRVVVVVVMMLCGLLLAGCRVRGDVEIRLDRDGSGAVAATLTLDADAVRKLERYAQGPLENQVLVLDLVAAGWRTAGWRRDGGGATLRLVHPFSDPSQVDGLVAAVVGDTGVVRRVVVRHERGVLRSRDRVSAVADLREVGSGVADDAKIRARLAAAGVDPNAIDLLLTAQLREALTLGLTVSVAGDHERVTVRPGERAAAAANASSFAGDRAVSFGAAGLLVVGGVVALVLAMTSGRAVRRRARSEAPRENGS